MEFLRRLVSRRGERDADADKVGGAKPDALVIADQTETVAEEGLEDAARPASLDAPHQDPSDAVSAETAPVKEADTETDDKADGVRLRIPTAGGSASANETGIVVNVAHEATVLEPAVAGVTRKQQGQSNSTRSLAVPAEVSQGQRTPSDETISLDEEIKALRGKLAERLKIQNAQLKKRLERFER
ncbi:hypothetical protein [Pseudorhizobium marinum]|uniref:hypothetical protein n=1 Tax=Pseudorhizobium marinum TaxID=1496690 RepID=UPI00068CB622|nr:hypothetical protein [Pseudorhizobium marinum]